MATIEIGQTYGRLTIKEKAKSINQRSSWFCICICGNEKIVAAKDLKNGDTKSCGCLNKEKAIINLKTAHLKRDRCHDAYESISRKIWKNMYSDGISYEDFMILSQQNCFYCNTTPKNKTRQTRAIFIYNGLDRVDSNKDHSLENVVTCCRDCNRAKNNMTKKEFYEMVNNIVENEQYQQSVLDEIQRYKNSKTVIV